ncbi:hypothetical protein ACQ5SO_17160 [Rhodovulum sp. DZ06]|uniref:hypothetical protein n=1 Tax=Rhodovulum sp. DZ06 TaxID=3425126 RepID=UPI003D33EF98
MIAKKLSPSSPEATDAELLRAEEAALGRALRAHRKALRTRPSLDDGPDGFARGPVELASVLEVDWDLRRGEYRPRPRAVVRRAGPQVLAALPLHCRDAAEAYAATVELVASVRSPGEGGAKGGISDGGAVMRCAAAEDLRRCRDAIGTGLALDPRGRRAHRDRARRPLPVRELVDAAALDGLSLSAILARAGWSRGPSVATPARAALEAALERVALVVGIVVQRGA